MSDNIKINEGSGPPTATDEISGVHYQRIKPAFGKDGIATDVSAENPLPVGGSALGTTTEPATTNTGGLIGVLKRCRQLLEGEPETALGSPVEAEVTGSGGIVGLLKRIRHLLEGAGSISLVPQTAGGLGKALRTSNGTTQATSLKAAPGQVYGWHLTNQEASWVYLKIYNIAEVPEVGVTAQSISIGIPPGGSVSASYENGLIFTTGIAIALTKSPNNTNTEAPATGAVQINLFYT